MAKFRCGQDQLTSGARDSAVGATTVNHDADPLAGHGSLFPCHASPAAAALGTDITRVLRFVSAGPDTMGIKSDANRACEALFASDQDLGGLDT